MTRVLLLLGLIAVLALGAGATPVSAASNSGILYLTDSELKTDGTTALFRVELDEATGRANLELTQNGILPVNQGDAIAASPGGRRIYVIDKLQAGQGDGTLGYYDVATAAWTDIGIVKDGGTPVGAVTLAAFWPDGVLYAASQLENSIYTVDTDTAAATLLGIVEEPDGTRVNVSGADLEFGADGTLYIWINTPKAGGSAPAPRGLYTLDLPASSGVVTANFLGAGGAGYAITGLAINDSGLGDLVAAKSEKIPGPGGAFLQGEILTLDKANGATIDTFQMFLNGGAYIYQFGDMTVARKHVTVCHNDKNTITVGFKAAMQHIDKHGDTLGPCG